VVSPGKLGCEGPDREESFTRVGQDERSWRFAVATTVLATGPTREPPAPVDPFASSVPGSGVGMAVKSALDRKAGYRSASTAAASGRMTFPTACREQGLVSLGELAWGLRTPAVITKMFDAGQGWKGQVAYHVD